MSTALCRSLSSRGFCLKSLMMPQKFLPAKQQFTNLKKKIAYWDGNTCSKQFVYSATLNWTKSGDAYYKYVHNTMFCKSFHTPKNYHINTTYSTHENALYADGLQSLPLKEDIPAGVIDLQNTMMSY